MKKLRWQLLVVLLALAAIAILLMGQQPALIPAEEEPTIQPISGGVYSEALIGSFGRLNPLLDMNNPVDRDVDRLIYSGLIRFDDHGSPQKDLADSWGISADGTQYNFSIKENATWHDGKPVTSQDVLFTVDLMRNEAIPLSADLRDFWNQVEVKALDEKTLQFLLPEPFAPFMDYLTFGILPEHLLSGLTPEQIIDAPFNLEPVGSGPYRFERLLVEGDQITGVVLESFKEYYAEPAFIDQIVFQYYPDASAALNAYQEGDVLGINHVTPQILDQTLQEPNLKVYTGRMPQLSLIYLNLGNNSLPFFQDAVVRRALLMGLNRQWLVDRIAGGQAIIADGPIFPGTWAYYDGIEHVGFDPDGALKLLKDAGYTIPAEGGNVRQKDGSALQFELVYPEEDPYPALAQAIQSDWSRLGVQVELKAVPYEQLISDYLEPRTYDAALVDLNLMHSPDPDPYPFWHQAQASGGQNYAGWDDRQASEYLESARVIVDNAERARRYRNFQVRFAKELPALPLFYPVYSYAVDSQVQGVSMGPLFDASDRFNTITSWYLREGIPSEESGSVKFAEPTPTPTPTSTP